MEFTLPCVAASFRGKLSHSILENLVLGQPGDVLADICRNDPSEPAAWRETAQALREALPGGYNPTALLDTSELRALPEAIRKLLEETLEARFAGYLATIDLVSVRRDLELFISACLAFERAARHPIPGWEQEYLSLRRAAEALQASLQLLPRGLWLP